MIFKLYCLQNESPNGTQIRPETGSETEGLWKVIFTILWWILAPRMGPKIYLKSIPKNVCFWYRCFWDFGWIWGTSFCIKWGDAVGSLPFFFGLRCGTPFLARHGGGTPSDRFQNGSILEGLDLDFGGFGTPFCDVFVTTWLPYALQSWSFLAVLF